VVRALIEAMAEERPPVLVFDGVRFGLELGTSLSLTQKVALKALIERHGGIVDAVFGPKVSLLSITVGLVCAESYVLLDPCSSTCYLVSSRTCVYHKALIGHNI